MKNQIQKILLILLSFFTKYIPLRGLIHFNNLRRDSISEETVIFRENMPKFYMNFDLFVEKHLRSIFFLFLFCLEFIQNIFKFFLKFLLVNNTFWEHWSDVLTISLEFWALIVLIYYLLRCILGFIYFEKIFQTRPLNRQNLIIFLLNRISFLCSVLGMFYLVDATIENQNLYKNYKNYKYQFKMSYPFDDFNFLKDLDFNEGVKKLKEQQETQIITAQDYKDFEQRLRYTAFELYSKHEICIEKNPND